MALVLAGRAAWTGTTPWGAVALRPSTLPRAMRAARAARIALMIVAAGVRAAARLSESLRARVLKSPLAVRLANGELGNRPRLRLRLDTRKAGANQGPMQPDQFRRRVGNRRVGWRP